MKTRWISSLQDRPRCRAADGAGQRCREPVLWDERTNRPLSTRCQAHGGLADATLTGWRLPDGNEPPDRMVPVCCAENVRESSARKRQTMDFGRTLGGLPALALAGALCLFLTAPALADFEAAVADYERGAYREALPAFEAASEAGDERAWSYLDRIRDKLSGTSRAVGSGAASGYAGSSETAQPGEDAAGQTPSDWEPGQPVERPVEPASPPQGESDIVAPQRRSVWSAIFHLPGDATVIGLQYVAQFLNAEKLNRELQMLGRNSNRIALGILAVGWWLAIIRVLVGFGLATSRILNVAGARKEQQHYG